MQPADGRRVVLQHGEQVPARLDLVLELDAGDGEQQRLLERRRGLCERADPLGVRGQRLCLGGGLGRCARCCARSRLSTAPAIATTSRTAPAGEQGAQPAVDPLFGAPLALGLGDAGVEEGALGGVELAAAGLGQLDGAGEPGAAVQVGGLATAARPRRARRR